MSGHSGADDLAAKGKALADSGKYRPAPAVEGNGYVPELDWEPPPEPPPDVDDHQPNPNRRKHSERTSEKPHDDLPTLLGGMFDGAWLDAQTFPPLEYAVPGIIPEGLGLFAGPPKLGKSWLVCGIGLACAAGGVALGRIHVPERPVLYLALEDGPRRLQSRCRRITADQPIPAAIHFVTAAKPTEVIAMIAEFLARHPDDKPLVVLDTLGRARPPRPAGADPYQWDYAVGSQLKATIDSVPGASLLVVHHTRKADAADFIDSLSGTQGIAGSADYVIVLARRRHEDDALVSVTGRDIPEAEYALTVEGGIWQLDGATLADARQTAQTRRETGRLGDRALEVLAFVNSREETRSADVANEFDMDPKRASEILARLAGDERITRLRRGVYTPVLTADSADSADNAGQSAIPFPQQDKTTADSADLMNVKSAVPDSTADNDPSSDQPNPHNPHNPHICTGCGCPLSQPEAIRRGNCTTCFLRGNTQQTPEGGR